MGTEQPSFRDEYVLGADGKPILDRFGRPVRRRPTTQRPPRRNGQRTQPPHQVQHNDPPPTRYNSQPTRFDGFAAQQPRVSQQSRPAQQPRQYIPPTQQRSRSSYASPAAPQSRQKVLPHNAYAAPAQPRRKKKNFRASGCLSIFTWLLAIIVVLSLATTFWLDSKLNRTSAKPATQVANTAGTNWLLVGSDSRAGLSEEEVQILGTGGDLGSMRTDTIMVLHLSKAGEATLISLPRDSYVNIPGYGMNKINAAFTFGGAPLLMQTVEEATGLRIDHYAEIGMGGLAHTVDAIGGIEICPAEPINDPLANLNIQAGCQTVDGPTALGYVRTRATALGDLDRVQRQREFFAALVAKLTSTGTLANPFRIIPTINTVANSFTVDEKDHIWHLLRVALAMRGGLTTETVPYAGFADYDVGNVVLWDEPAAQALFQGLS
ncbi:LytR family transcriptional regulator [Corynebacterium kutscheri]|uniref:LytR family transcriptional regulator n=1 Tax=Corynebacterium kutscheri TaxID=35755 RepID=A0A0F6R3A5_9CORY|nr:LCP family protein [Corynebacterium kutscheri]AKE42153.1 transcriptional attenuator, LytR family [Corynebacterium kutscheri]VEH05872.1 LytR family transcriptional regulator [Corynebacterium kutscheri]VEH10496.1 LytR family transcriptional regulator [Corynebacterium kutscheri]VEH81764.1 LytR family transcriptional regulator [Corynebacterium kutscheri]